MKSRCEFSRTGFFIDIKYPILSDIHKTIARDYGVLNAEEGIALRGLFLIDREQVVQHVTINASAIGRNVDEVLRSLDALQHAETHGEVCPANWARAMRASKPITNRCATFSQLKFQVYSQGNNVRTRSRCRPNR